MNAALLSLALFSVPFAGVSEVVESASEGAQTSGDDPVAPAQAEPAEGTVAAPRTSEPVPPMTQPAQESAPSHPHDDSAATQAPLVGIGDQTIPVQGPRLGLTVRGASVGPDGTYVHADAQSWGALVHNDPQLAEMYRLSRLREPGIIMTTLFGTWAVLSLTISADLGQPESHTGRFFAYGLPALGLAAGIPMTIVGVKNRRNLHREHMRVAAAPVVTPDGAALAVVGRF